VNVGGEISHLRQLPGDNRVQSGSAGVVEDRLRLHGETLSPLQDRRIHIGVVCAHLQRVDLSVLDGDVIGERTPDVDPDHSLVRHSYLLTYEAF
jgi:hypothetical protein